MRPKKIQLQKKE